jgi:hypothetical protein
MIKCGNPKVPCNERRKGNCENTQGVCPIDGVISMFVAGKSLDQIENETGLNQEWHGVCKVVMAEWQRV